MIRSSSISITTRGIEIMPQKERLFYKGSVKHSVRERQSRFIVSDIQNEMMSKFHKGPDKL